jgi:antitoxin (DNA-binding transcriptional repressor) of toxin-antitoxin stability system
VSTSSVAQAKAGLTGLINRARAGESVMISRTGEPTVGARPAAPAPSTTAVAARERPISDRVELRAGARTPVERLNMIYDKPVG